jgi:hypothetical protein
MQGRTGMTGPSGLAETALYSPTSLLPATTGFNGFLPNLVNPFILSLIGSDVYALGPNVYELNTGVYDGSLTGQGDSPLSTADFSRFQGLFGTNLNGVVAIVDPSYNVTNFQIPINPLGFTTDGTYFYTLGYSLNSGLCLYQTDTNFNFVSAFFPYDGAPQGPTGPVSIIVSGSLVIFPSQSNLNIYNNSTFTFNQIPTSFTETFPLIYFDGTNVYIANDTGFDVINITTSAVTSVAFPDTGQLTSFNFTGGIAYFAGTYPNFYSYNGALSSTTNPYNSVNSLNIGAMIFDQSLPQGYFVGVISDTLYLVTFSQTSPSTILNAFPFDVFGVNLPAYMIQDSSGTIQIPYYGIYHYVNPSGGQQMLAKAYFNGNGNIKSHDLFPLSYDPARQLVFNTSYYATSNPSQVIDVYGVSTPGIVARSYIGHSPVQILDNGSNFYVFDGTASFFSVIDSSGSVTNVNLDFLPHDISETANVSNLLTFAYNGAIIGSSGYAFMINNGFTYFDVVGGTGVSGGYLNVISPSLGVSSFLLDSNSLSNEPLAYSDATRSVYFEHSATSKGNEDGVIGESDYPYTSYFDTTGFFPSAGIVYAGNSGGDIIYNLNNNLSKAQEIVDLVVTNTFNLHSEGSKNTGANLVYSSEVNKVYINSGFLNIINSAGNVISYEIGINKPIVLVDNEILVNFQGVTGPSIAGVNIFTDAIDYIITTDIAVSTPYPNFSFATGVGNNFYVSTLISVSEYNVVNGNYIQSQQVYQTVPGYVNAYNLMYNAQNNQLAVALLNNSPFQTPESYSVVIYNLNSTGTIVDSVFQRNLQSKIFVLNLPARTTFNSVPFEYTPVEFVFPNALPANTTVDSVNSLTVFLAEITPPQGSNNYNDELKVNNTLSQSQPGFSSFQIANTTGTLNGTTLTISGVIYGSNNIILNQNTAFTFLVTYG